MVTNEATQSGLPSFNWAPQEAGAVAPAGAPEPIRLLGECRLIWLSLSWSLGFPGGSAGKESSCNVGVLGLIPGLGRSLGEKNGYPLQYSGLENSMDYSPWGQKELDTTE